MREPDQRFWDALIIRAWNNFDSCINLRVACKYEFGCYPEEASFIRTKYCYGGVRAWVATALPKLSEKLWILPKERHVELLDWLEHTKLDCVAHNKQSARYYREARNAAKRGDNLAEQQRISYELGKLLNPMNQFNVVKQTHGRNRRGR